MENGSSFVPKSSDTVPLEKLVSRSLGILKPEINDIFDTVVL